VRNPIGTHVKTGSGLVTGTLPAARRIGAEVLQVFVGNPRGWALSPGRPDVDSAFREQCARAGLRVVVHTPYLVNVGAPSALTYERSVASVAHNLRRAVEIGAEGVVVHTGSCVDEGGYDAGLRRVREGLLPLLDGLEGSGVWLLLEPTAGQGRSLCAGVAGLPAYLAALDHHPRAAVCLDTCHAFAAGAPLDRPGGATATLDAVVAAAGPGALRLVHANDSADPRGSRRDRHAPIGEGHIGTGAFAELFGHPATAGVPFVLETPGSRDVGDAGTRRLRELRAAAALGRTA
jgi:deoxyribonuclease-4